MKYPRLRTLRVGCVKYLNSVPLIHDFDGPVVFEHPSVLARMLHENALDVALVPVFEALRHPGYRLVDGASIASDGAVFSVFLAYRGELSEVRKVSLDPASLSSAHLLRVLLAEYHGLHPEYGGEGDARLLIGNQAIEFRLDRMNEDWRILDLGAEWKRCTGLPFVFALWAMRPEVPREAADELRELKECGVRSIPEIVGVDDFSTPAVRHRYLTEHIRFDVGEAGRRAIRLYADMLVRHALISEPGALEFV